MKYVPSENFHVIDRLIKAYDLLKLNSGAEIGVRTGVFSEYLLRQNSDLTMICVDPYLPYQDVYAFITQEDQDNYKREARDRLYFRDRVLWTYKRSEIAALAVAGKSLDFVFIDGEHTYDAVIVDIECWLPRVREGGMISGHDIDMDPVNRAVHYVAKCNNLEVFRSPSDEGACWWMVK